jgi:transitional endoplasmic reticulum ATPase
MPEITNLGQLAKVIFVSDQVVYFRLLDGRVAESTGWDDTTQIRPGEIYLISDENAALAPEQLWTDHSALGVIREVVAAGVVIDDGFRLTLLPHSAEINASIGSTVEFSDERGVIQTISDRPLYSDRTSQAPSANEFLTSTGSSNLTFGDFGGFPDVVERAKELIETQLEKADIVRAIGARPVKGVLFTGPPGSGKTHLARIIAAESDAEFYLVSGPSIVSKWVGDSEDTLRTIFKAAETSSRGRSIIFFDEIDSIAERRSGESHEASKRLVAQLLTLLDGFESAETDVVVIAATNRVDDIDPALLRAGRFDWEIEFGVPAFADRLDILEVSRRSLATTPNLPLLEIAEITDGWSSAQLASIWTEAALVCASDGRPQITGEDMAIAVERIRTRPMRGVRTEEGPVS